MRILDIMFICVTVGGEKSINLISGGSEMKKPLYFTQSGKSLQIPIFCKGTNLIICPYFKYLLFEHTVVWI